MIHSKIKKLREELGLTQADMAEYLHISQNAYSSIERGRTKIDIERLYKIAKKLDSQVTDFLGTNSSYKTNHPESLSAIELKELVCLKDKQIQQLIQHTFLLLLTLEKLNMRNQTPAITDTQ